MNMSAAAANELIKKASGGNIATIKDVVTLGHALQKQGYQISEHPAFGGVHAGHVAGSWHYKNRALDISHDPGEEPWGLETMYWMFGVHDGIAIVEAPDSLTMAGISTAIRSTGAVRSDARAVLKHRHPTSPRARPAHSSELHPARSVVEVSQVRMAAAHRTGGGRSQGHVCPSVPFRGPNPGSGPGTTLQQPVRSQ